MQQAIDTIFRNVFIEIQDINSETNHFLFPLKQINVNRKMVLEFY
jgi:hypothetical protein